MKPAAVVFNYCMFGLFGKNHNCQKAKILYAGLPAMNKLAASNTRASSKDYRYVLLVSLYAVITAHSFENHWCGVWRVIISFIQVKNYSPINMKQNAAKKKTVFQKLVAYSRLVTCD